MSNCDTPNFEIIIGDDTSHEKVAADFYGPLPTREYLLLVVCKYSRYLFIEVVTSTTAKAVIPKFEEFSQNLDIHWRSLHADNGPFKLHEFKDYAVECGFSIRKITPAEHKINGKAERFMKNMAKTVQTAIVEKRNCGRN